MVKNLSVTGAIVVAVVFGVLYFKGPAVITVPQITQLGSSQQASPIVNVEAAKPVVIPAPVVHVNVPKQEAPKLGAVSSNYILGPDMSVGGVLSYYADVPMKPATTTPCSIQAPAATSTLMFASWQITVGTSTAATIDLGTSTTAFATTTNKVAAKSIAANAKGYAVWTPAGAGLDDNIMAPNTWVVIKTAGAGLGGYTYTGQCQAVFTVI